MIIGCFIVLIVIAATLVAVNRAVREQTQAVKEQSKLLLEIMRKFTETTGGEWTEDE